MRPLLVLSVGRSGTTMVMRVLASHPQIVADETYPLEFVPFQAAVFADDARAQASIGGLSPLSIDGARALYDEMSRKAGKRALYFAEKCPVWRDATEIVKRDAGARFVCIVRDPRDVLVSARAFDAKRGFRGFQERDGDSDAALVEKYRVLYEKTLTSIDATRAYVVRYEDVVAAPVSGLSGLWDHLGLDASEATASHAAKRARDMEDGSHRTGAPGAVARWRQELPPALRALYAERLRPVFERFGYPLA